MNLACDRLKAGALKEVEMSTAFSTHDTIEKLMAEGGLEQGRLQPAGEKRRMQRRRVFRGAVLHSNCGTVSVECLVRNLSGQGAMVKLDPLGMVQETFVFRLAGDDCKRQAELVWRRGGMAGLRFF